MGEKTVLITGGGSGIGLATITQLLASARVAKVLAMDLNVSNLETLARDYPEKLHIFAGDVTQESDRVSAINTLVEKAGRITDLILNAGTFKPLGDLPMISLEAWKRTFDVNFFSIVQMVRLAWPHLLETQGSIMVTSSRVSLQPAQFWTCYATSKSALNYFISCIPLETSNVRCVAMTPGLVDTPLLGNAIHDDEVPPHVQDFMKKGSAAGNALSPDEPARGFLKLVEAGIPEEMNGKTLYWEDIVNS